jgi:ADP-heptose:LPS heptosyltransferase
VTAKNGDTEGLPNVVIEALAAGVPVIGSRHGGIVEAVDDGRTGFLVPPGDATAVADVFKRLVVDPQAQRVMGKNARGVAVERFSAVTQSRLLEDTLLSVINDAARTSQRATRLGARDFPAGTPLHAFFAWNEARLIRDRRFVVACDIHRLLARFGAGAKARMICVAHLAARPVILWRLRQWMPLSAGAQKAAIAALQGRGDDPAAMAARQLVDSLSAGIGSDDLATHAAFFRACEALEAIIDLDALARLHPRRQAAKPAPSPASILVIKLSALGDFIQALGPAAAIRRHHARDHITLLTTEPYAVFARDTGLFDEVVIDRRPGVFDLEGWLALRRLLRAGRFHHVYDLQTSDRSSLYARLFAPGPRPQWTGIAWRCSHPHANLDRFPQHTIDKQAEQLLMAGIYPVPLPSLPALARSPPANLQHRSFALLIPGSSPRHLRKRWPTEHYGELARRLNAAGYLPVIVGAPGEEDLATTVQVSCTEAIDLVGKTDLSALADLARRAALTIGNDTGAIHIAAAGGNPVVVLFSAASDPSRCAPRGGPVRILAESDLAELSVDRVFSAAIEVAGARADKRLERSDCPKRNSLEGFTQLPS